MTIRVKIPSQLRQLTGGNAEIEIDGATTIRELLEKVGADYPQAVERVVDENGELRKFVNLYLGDDDIRFLQGLDTPVEDGATIAILPAVAGG